MNTIAQPRSNRLQIVLLIAGAMLVPGSIQAQPAKPNPVAAKNARTASELAKKQSEALTAKHAQSAAEIKKGADGLVTAYQAAAAAQLKLAEAYEAGVAADVAAAFADAAKASAAVSRGNELLTTLQYVATQSSETPIAALTKSTPEAAAPQLEAYLTTRKAAAAAGSKLAAALTPDAAAEMQDAARDEWFAADNDLKLALKVLNNARDLASRANLAAKTSNADLSAKVEELKKTDVEVIGLIKQQNELQLKLRKLERQRLQTAAAATELAKPKKK